MVIKEIILANRAYFLHTIGELFASPNALSFVTKLSPAKYASLMMGLYFAATGFGSKLAGTIGEMSQVEPIEFSYNGPNLHEVNIDEFDTSINDSIKINIDEEY